MSKLIGKYRGRVENNVDPQQRARLQISSPTALGAGVLAWADACLPYAQPGVGLLSIPPVGAEVWVEFEGGDPASPVWSGFVWSAPLPPTADPGDVVIATDGGPRILLSSADRSVSVIHPNGASIELSASGDITIRSTGSIGLSASSITLEGNTVSLSADLVRASAVMQCQTLIADSVVSASYTPGTGNIS